MESLRIIYIKYFLDKMIKLCEYYCLNSIFININKNEKYILSYILIKEDLREDKKIFINWEGYYNLL